MPARRLPAPSLPAWIEAMLPEDTRRYRVEVEGLTLHVCERGPEDAPPVLLLHGNPTWSFLYRKVAGALRGSPLRLVIPDLPGLGLSEKPRDPAFHTLRNHARVLGGLIDALALERVIFVGQDWGGPIGLRALAERPGRLAGLVVLNTTIGPPKRGFKPTAFHRFSRAPLISDVAFRGLQFPQAVMGMAQGDPDSIRGDVARAYRYPLRRFPDRVAPLAMARMVPNSLAHPSVPELERCKQLVSEFAGPVSIVWGERDPILGRLLRRTQRWLPRASVRVTQAGHFLQEEVPGPIAAAIREVAGLEA
ncbi:MAG: alpha/beta fold hydrolase [Myxococcales bacterium]|nr:alpha/beta fold hydrolase [Myxococcales bacterium]MCB9751716.1 alpha/beta fold hydrolase [Myxococcales bacterium]